MLSPLACYAHAYGVPGTHLIGRPVDIAEPGFGGDSDFARQDASPIHPLFIAACSYWTVSSWAGQRVL